MAYYQAHVVLLCKEAGFLVTGSGCPVVGAAEATRALEFQAGGVSKSSVSAPGRKDFDRIITSAAAHTALSALLQDATGGSAYARQLWKEHQKLGPAALDVPPQVLQAEMDGLRSIFTTLTAALMFKSSDGAST